MPIQPELAHGVGRVYESPLPVGFYLLGAGLTVLASFLIRAFARPEGTHPSYRLGGQRAAGLILASARIYFLTVFGLVVGLAIAYSDQSGFGIPPLMFWVAFIIIPIVLCSLLRGLWPQTSHWMTIEGFYRAIVDEEEPGDRVPPWLPSVLIYGLFWFELVSGRGFDPVAILFAVLAYTVYCLSLRRRYGERAAEAEPLGILFGYAQQMAPLEIVDDRVVYRGFVAGLDQARPMPTGRFLAVFILLASTTLDNLRETVQWFDFQLAAGLESMDARLLDSIALVVLTLPFALPFLACALAARRWAHRDEPWWDIARRFGWSLIPIGIAYVLAHNMPLLVTGLPNLIEQITDGLGFSIFSDYQASPLLVWILEIGLIVGGHVIGVLAAHRAAIRIAGSHRAALKSHVALTVLMSLFTVFTLWLLSLPLVTSDY